MINFSSIKPFHEGQRYSFEELVCQLARLEDFIEGSIFKRIDGAGGDGGVEAYWTKPNGRKTGYQAKYFLRSKNIDWAQIDKSVKQALTIHPELESYIIALPCDLTDKTGQKKLGKKGWEHWELRVEKWKNEAAKVGNSTIQFHAWTTSEMTSKLAQSSASGLRKYFFGTTELSTDWFKKVVQSTIFELGERYHPEDHVNLNIETLSAVLSRSISIKTELQSSIDDLKKSSKVAQSIPKEIEQALGGDVLEGLKRALCQTLNIENQIWLDPQHDWNIDSWADIADNLQSANNKLQVNLRVYSASFAKNSYENKQLKVLIDNGEKLAYAAQEISNSVHTRYLEAENTRIAFIRGAAGSGKSHLLAQYAQNAVEKNQPVVFLLGQQFNDSNLFLQIAQKLGLSKYSPEDILGALNAAGEYANVRTLLLIDAINEGVGSRYWKDQIAGFINKVQGYSHVCCIISCRSEYFDLAIPNAISESYQVFDIRGFESHEEQLNAARVYLDRRGIARPSTPWLSPEFINPLFLRSVCLSLERDKKSEFPPGLTGTKKILKYYLDSVGRSITDNEGCATSLVPNLGRAVIDIAGSMLASKADYLALDSCNDVISKHFRSILPRRDHDWLSLFLNNGILRKDPNPHQGDDEFADEDVIRFSFQRFQDFLMAESSLQRVSNPQELFSKNGVLDFCIKENFLSWKWQGLMSGLAIAIPEKFDQELIDVLPGGFDQWREEYSIPGIFSESVRWRSHEYFSERTLELLNEYWDELNGFELLLQTAVSIEHPWNAEFLHKNLAGKLMPERDAFWSIWVNDQFINDEYNDSSVDALIEWGLNGQSPKTNDQNQLLAALTLCWLFTSSNRTIRDKATKALTNIFIHSVSIFPQLLEKLHEVDDLYVLERLLAAAYGASCIDPNIKRLKDYSEVVFNKVFKSGKPLYGILLRDYSFGIIELADYHSVLPETVDFDCCKPPYVSAAPDLSVTEQKLNEIAEVAGGREILHSCSAGFMGDFSKYEIPPRVRIFLNELLEEDMPLSDEQREEIFEEEIVGEAGERFERYKVLKWLTDPVERPFKNLTTAELEECEKTSLGLFLELLSKEDIDRFHLEAEPFLRERKRPYDQEKRLDADAIKRWVAKRAYDFGWTKELFPHDVSRSNESYTRKRPNVERIGKKYQWLALDELLSRLADNYWCKDTYGSSLPKAYSSPVDLGSERDIDPTILIDNRNLPYISKTNNRWAFEPWIVLDNDVEEESLASWPFEKNPAEKLKTLPFRTDSDGVKWLVIYEHQSITHNYEDIFGESSREHSSRIQEFRFVETALILKSKVKNYVDNVEEKGLSRGVGWSVSEVTNEAFLQEAPWRSTWEQEKWEFDSGYASENDKHAKVAAQYSWESHLDESLPEGYSIHLPQPWVAHELDLKPDLEQAGIWRDKEGEAVFKELKGGDGGSICLLREDKAKLLKGSDQTFLSLLIAERNAWPHGNNASAAWRRTEGVCYQHGRVMNFRSWNRDNENLPK